MRGLLGAVALAALAATGCSGPAEGPRHSDNEPLLTLTVSAVTEGTMPSSFEAGGIVRARTTASLSSRVLAPVTDVRVRAGDRVRRGQVLVVLDGREWTSRAEAARASLQSAEEGVRAAGAAVETAAAGQKLAAATFARVNELHARRSATPQELDQATAALGAADSALAGARASSAAAAASRDAARAGFETASVASSYTELRAPFDGTVAARAVDAGAMASPGATLLTLEDTSALQVEATLDEARVALVSPGSAIDVLLDQADNAWLAARVVEVARVSPASHQAVVKAELPAGTAARTGAFARLRLAGPPRTGLTIPAGSVVRRGQLSFVFVPDAAARARLRAVSLGQRRDGRVEVLAGLAAGEPVVDAPPPDLADGRLVTTASGARSPAPRGVGR